MPRGVFLISTDPAGAIHEIYQMAAIEWHSDFRHDLGRLSGVTHFMFEIKGYDFFLMPYLTLHFLTPRILGALSPKNYAAVFFFGPVPGENCLRI